MRKPVLCEVDDRGDPVRIFKPQKRAYQFPVKDVNEFPYAFAVGVIRSKVFARAGCTRHQKGYCEECGRAISWESGHMHERVFKGKGGEVSVENGVAICAPCHLGPNGAHGNRRWHTSKINSTKET